MLQVTASFDDGSADDWRSYQLMKQYGIPTTFYIPVNYKKYLGQKGIAPLEDEQLQAIAEDFEIGSHGVNHELLTRVDEATARYEIESSKSQLEDMFNQEVRKFCYPRGYFDDKIVKIVKETGYSMARTVIIGSLDPLAGFTAATTIHVGYDRKEYEGEDWYTYADKKLTEALERAQNGIPTEYHMWGHGAEISKYGQWERFEKLLRVIDENLPS